MVSHIQIRAEACEVCNPTVLGTMTARQKARMARNPLLHRIFKRLRDSSGGSLVEAALITPLLLLLTFGICDFGAMFYVYLALENGISQATRYGVTGNQMDDPTNPGTQLSRADSMKLAMRQATPTQTIPDSYFTFNHLPVGSATWVSG